MACKLRPENMNEIWIWTTLWSAFLKMAPGRKKSKLPKVASTCLSFCMSGDCVHLLRRIASCKGWVHLLGTRTIQYKVHCILKIRPHLHFSSKNNLPKTRERKPGKEGVRNILQGKQKSWLFLEWWVFFFNLDWIHESCTLNLPVSGFLLQGNLFKYESQIMWHHVWYRNMCGNIKQIKFLRRLVWIEAILSIV